MSSGSSAARPRTAPLQPQLQRLLRSGGEISPPRSAPPRAEALGRLPRHTAPRLRSEEHTSELQSRLHIVCRLLLEKKKKTQSTDNQRRSTDDKYNKHILELLN